MTAAASGVSIAGRLAFVLAMLVVLCWAPAAKRDWPAVAITAVVVLVATAVFWLWALSDLTGGWYG